VTAGAKETEPREHDYQGICRTSLILGDYSFRRQLHRMRTRYCVHIDRSEGGNWGIYIYQWISDVAALVTVAVSGLFVGERGTTACKFVHDSHTTPTTISSA
jgi:hypothetical protein